MLSEIVFGAYKVARAWFYDFCGGQIHDWQKELFPVSPNGSVKLLTLPGLHGVLGLVHTNYLIFAGVIL